MIKNSNGIIQRAQQILNLIEDMNKCKTNTMINYAKEEIKSNAKGIINYIRIEEKNE